MMEKYSRCLCLSVCVCVYVYVFLSLCVCVSASVGLRNKSGNRNKASDLYDATMDNCSVVLRYNLRILIDSRGNNPCP